MPIHRLFLRLFFLLFTLVITVPAWGVELKFLHQEGEQWHIVATVQEEVFVNGESLFQSEILNRIAAKVLSTADGQGDIEASYRIAERFSDEENYAWSVDLSSRFFRDETGHIILKNPLAALPMVRDIPAFPEYALNPGDNWSAPGMEVFDLAPRFDIEELLPMEFMVNYVYQGPRVKDDRKVELIKINYEFGWEVNPREVPYRYPQWRSPYPQAIRGVVESFLWWDTERGKPYVSEGEFRYDFVLDNSEVWTFHGKSQGQSTFASPLDKGALARELQDLNEVKAEVVEEGVKVILDKIHFVPDKAQILPQEEKKLEEVGQILKKYPGRDILITGHTAKVDRDDGKELSKKRAGTVAEYFLREGVRQVEEMVIRGMGDREPLGDNSTDEGRQKNRRVEIIIMEN